MCVYTFYRSIVQNWAVFVCFRFRAFDLQTVYIGNGARLGMCAHISAHIPPYLYTFWGLFFCGGNFAFIYL